MTIDIENVALVLFLGIFLALKVFDIWAAAQRRRFHREMAEVCHALAEEAEECETEIKHANEVVRETQPVLQQCQERMNRVLRRLANENAVL